MESNNAPRQCVQVCFFVEQCSFPCFVGSIHSLGLACVSPDKLANYLAPSFVGSLCLDLLFCQDHCGFAAQSLRIEVQFVVRFLFIHLGAIFPFHTFGPNFGERGTPQPGGMLGWF